MEKYRLVINDVGTNSFWGIVVRPTEEGYEIYTEKRENGRWIKVNECFVLPYRVERAFVNEFQHGRDMDAFFNKWHDKVKELE